MDTLLSVIPVNDSPVFGRLSAAAQNKAIILWDACVEIERLAGEGTPVLRACDIVAREKAGLRGCSPVSLKKRYYAWLRSGRDWQTVIDRAMAPQHSQQRETLPAATAEWWRGICEQHQRSIAAAYRDAHRRMICWQQGVPDAEPVPGYLYPPENEPGTGLPANWSLRTFERYKPEKAQLAVTRTGREAAKAASLCVWTTRRGLAVGQYVLFDDIWHDNYIVAPGKVSRPCRPLEFHALDLASACKVAWGVKPQLDNETTGGRHGLKHVEFLHLVICYLLDYGYREDTGTVFIGEHGTAVFTARMREVITLASGGKIRFSDSGISDGRLMSGLYGGQGKGNFRIKAALESSGNLYHNELDALPGQTGRNRDNQPVATVGACRVAQVLLDAAAQMPAHLADLLRYSVPTMRQFNEALLDMYHRINTRTEHALEGWQDDIISEYRVDHQSAWMPLHGSISPILREHLASHPHLMRRRNLSPWEKCQSGRSELRRMREEFVPMLLALHPGAAEARRVEERGIFTLRQGEEEPLRYLATVRGEHSLEIPLKRGDTYLIYTLPPKPDRIWVCAENGAFLGTCPALDTPRRDDEEGVRRSMGRATASEAALLEGPRRRAEPQAAQQAADRAHNARVLAEAGARPKRKPAAKPATARPASPVATRNVFAALPVASAPAEQEYDWLC